MKHFFKYYALSIILLFAGACSDGPAREPAATPEEVLRDYQAYIDKNEFDKAMALSTPEEKARLNVWARRILSNQYRDHTIMTTIFLDVDCEVLGDVARCLCLVEDEYERYNTEYFLVKVEGQWLVDAPEETFEIDEETINRMLENVQ